MKDPIPNPLLYTILFVQAVMSITLVRDPTICHKELRSIWKRIKCLTFSPILLLMKIVKHLVLEIVLK